MNFLQQPKIGIVGLGFVGGAVRDAMEGSCDLVLVDKDTSRGPNTFADLHNCEGIFVCVPTPQSDDGTCDTSTLEWVLEQLKDYDGVIISKCTAPPLVYKALNETYKNLVHAPEFLTAANAKQDYFNGKFAFIGGRVKAYLNQARDIIVWGQPGIVDNITFCSIEEAALAKYTINTFLATKISFMNEMWQLCQSIGADYATVARMVIQDHRIGRSHMQVPGPDGQFGFGGMCFPKDTAALLKFARDADLEMNVLNAAVKKNTLLRLQGPK
jgi:nucleotide sugar dehydrogenase